MRISIICFKTLRSNIRRLEDVMLYSLYESVLHYKLKRDEVAHHVFEQDSSNTEPKVDIRNVYRF